MTIYIPDSNILSEVAKPQPNKKVIDEYLHNISNIYVATTVWHELHYGLNIMPMGKRRKMVEDFLFTEVMNFPVCGYTKESATIHAKMRADCRKKGRTLAFADSQIASIAIANDAVLVTRNKKDFVGIDGLAVVNWFE